MSDQAKTRHPTGWMVGPDDYINPRCKPRAFGNSIALPIEQGPGESLIHLGKYLDVQIDMLLLQERRPVPFKDGGKVYYIPHCS